jgi:hypothetical protein
MNGVGSVCEQSTEKHSRCILHETMSLWRQTEECLEIISVERKE